jgi:hypothetical protein
MAEIKKSISWPVGIAVFYGIFAFALIGFLIFSIFLKNDLVSTDYYAKELIHQKQIDRIQRTQKLGYKLNWHFDNNKDALIIQFPADLDFSEINGIITFFRPSDAKLDKVFSIRLNPEGKQVIPTQDIDTGNWRLKISWQNSDGEFYQDGQITLQ